MPSSGRLLEGSIAVVGCAVILTMHGYMAARSTVLRIGGWWRDQKIVRAEEKAARQAKGRWARALDRWDDAQMEANNRLCGDDDASDR